MIASLALNLALSGVALGLAGYVVGPRRPLGGAAIVIGCGLATSALLVLRISG